MATQPADPSTDPSAAYVNISCFDLLLIELIPLAERMAREYEASLDRPSLVNKYPSTKAALHSTNNAPSATGGAPAAGVSLATDGQPETELFKETVFYRLESLGYRVGLGLTERFSRDRPRSTDQLDVIKFLCKDLWMVVFKKQIDNLKTNHRVSACLRQCGGTEQAVV
jgi:trafficking protein particle complex subunit 6